MGLSKIFILSVFTFSLVSFSSPSEALEGRLPRVSPKMERAEFWIKKIGDPVRLLLKAEEIRKLNEENLKDQDLLLCRVSDLRQEWTREELLSLLKEDWDGFGDNGKVQYGKDGRPIGEAFWDPLRKNWNQDSFKERNRILFGLIIRRTDLRVFPTDAPSLSSPASPEFDRFQHSSVSPGSLVGIYAFSKDQKWAYVQTRFIRGWVHADALAVTGKNKEATDYEGVDDRLVVTGSFVDVFDDPSLKRKVFTAQMGASFPLLHLPASSGMGRSSRFYAVKIPSRENDGELSFKNGYISRRADVHRGFLPYSQENVARQAFKMLNQPYGWGEMSGGRDCSRFIMDLFESFGILMPRNSMLQARVGIDLGREGMNNIEGKRRILDRAVPLATTLRLPGHIMLYLGKDKGRYYVIHNVWGVQKAGPSGPVHQKIGRTVVSDLSLGETGPNGSLLERITDIRFVGNNSLFPHLK